MTMAAESMDMTNWLIPYMEKRKILKVYWSIGTFHTPGMARMIVDRLGVLGRR